MVIAAHGRRSRLDRQLGRSFIAGKHPYVGFKRHHRPLHGHAAPGAGTVEMFTLRGGYCGLAPIEGGLVNMCMLLHQKLLSQIGTTQWESLLQALGRMNPALGQRLAELAPDDAVVQAVAQVPMVFKERTAHGLLFIGDAAGMIAPLVGDGQGMALESAVLLAELVQRMPARPGRAELGWLARSWDRTWRRWFSWRLRLGRLFQSALLRPHAADLVLALLDGAAPLKNYLVRVTRGK
jgi:flavin-dependent dehydrogenase